MAGHVTIATHVRGTCEHTVSCTCGWSRTERLSSSDAERRRQEHAGTHTGGRGKRGAR